MPDASLAVHRTTAAALFALALALALASSALAANQVFVGTFGFDAGDVHVYRLESGGTWTDLGSPAPGLEGIRHLAWIDGQLWAATGYYDHGGVYRHDGRSWEDLSPVGGFEGPVSFLVSLGDEVLALDLYTGLYRWDGGNAWTSLGEADGMGQAILSSSHDGRPLLFIGSEWEDSFWVHDPDGLLACGADCPDATGDICPAECFPGSCIYSLTEYDDGIGPLVFAGALDSIVYRWDPAARTFSHAFELGLFSEINGMAQVDDALWMGLSDGTIRSTADLGDHVAIEHDFGTDAPITRLVRDEDSGLLWLGFGEAPWSGSGDADAAMVRSFDGLEVVDHPAPGGFGDGVSTLIIAPPPITIDCDAGPAQVVECAGGETPVVLDGSLSFVEAPSDVVVDYTWTGPFLEGSAGGLSPEVHFPGPGDYEVLLTISADSESASCSSSVGVVDTTPPRIEAADATLGCLWPPNHRLVRYSREDFAPAVEDACDGAAAWWIVGCESDQPDDSLGDGHTAADCEVAADGESLRVRAERQGGDRTGRGYAVTIVATDAAGNESAPTRIGWIRVPHDGSPASRCRP